MTIYQMPMPRHSRIPGLIDPRVPATISGPPSVAGCQLWWSANSLILNDGDPITSITDQSTGGRDGSTANPPTYKVNIINGLPAMRFPHAGHPYIWHSSPYTSANATWFVLWSRADATNNDFILGVASYAYSYLQYGDNWYVYDSTSLAIPMAAGSFRLKCCTYDGVNYQRYTNSVAEASQAGGGGFNSMGLGHSSYECWGDFVELVYYDHCLTDADRIIVETYFNNKYALW